MSSRRLGFMVAALIALARPLGWAGAATPPTPGIRVFDGENRTVALFTSARCAVTRAGFIAVAYDHGYVLYIHARHFTGFHKYELRRGVYNGTFIEVRSPSLVYFASDFVPPYHVPGGGELNFASGGKLLGGGFYPMFNESGTDGVGVAGRLTCHYPQRRTRT
jgi:hypothetical protein